MPCLADKGTDLIKSVQTLYSSLNLFFFIMLLMKFLSFIAGSLTSAAGGGGGEEGAGGGATGATARAKSRPKPKRRWQAALSSILPLSTVYTAQHTTRQGGEGARKGCKVVGQACYGFTSYSLDYGIYFFNLCTISLSSTGNRKRKGKRRGSRRPTTSRSLSISRRNWLQLMMKWKQKWDRVGEGERGVPRNRISCACKRCVTLVGVKFWA